MRSGKIILHFLILCTSGADILTLYIHRQVKVLLTKQNDISLLKAMVRCRIVKKLVVSKKRGYTIF